MGFLKWVYRRGAVGGYARWGARMYRINRDRFPDVVAVSDWDIFNRMVASRYARLPHPKAEAFMGGFMQNSHIGLRNLVIGLLLAENNWDIDDLPGAFLEVIDEELEKSGLPESVLQGC
jgi:hypothetical protein